METCSCIAGNTQSCDNVNGSCTCLSGWQGSTCAEDVNECLTISNLCSDPLKECNNTNGSFACTCMSGYRLYANLKCVGKKDL